MTKYAVVLIRGTTPDRSEARKLIELRMDGYVARIVQMLPGWETKEFETCEKAFSRHPALIAQYGVRGVLFDKASSYEPEGVSVKVVRIGSDVEEGPSGMKAPLGYRIEKRGPYHRLLHLDSGESFPDKMLHKEPFLAFLESFEGV